MDLRDHREPLESEVTLVSQVNQANEVNVEWVDHRVNQDLRENVVWQGRGVYQVYRVHRV